jgi:hypothetical protein
VYRNRQSGGLPVEVSDGDWDLRWTVWTVPADEELPGARFGGVAGTQGVKLMKTITCALVIWAIVAGVAAADPYDVSNGVVIAHAPSGLVYTVEPPAPCDAYAAAPITACDQQINRIDTADQPRIWFVLLAWGDGTETKYWRGFEFGLGDFVAGGSGYLITQHSYCPVPQPGSVLTIASENWPGPNAGIQMTATGTTEDVVWSGNFEAMYWFAGYAYSTQVIPLGPNPETGDVTLLPLPGHGQPVQVELDTEAEGILGGMGMLTDGIAACPPSDVAGACCFWGNECQEITLGECEAQGGTFQGGGTVCSPNPCPTVWACCLSEGTPGAVCFMFDESTCAAYGGVWHANHVCIEEGGGDSPIDCENPPPAVTFTDIDAELPGLGFSSAAWGDFDNDWDLDIVLAGSPDSGSTGISRVYRSDPWGTFSDIGAGLPGLFGGSVAWGDFDNDGDLDLVLTGNTGEEYLTRAYQNDGGGGFTDLDAGLPGVCSSSVAWGDCDNDGDLDLLLAGDTGEGRIARIYSNGGTGAFSDLNAGFPGTSAGSAAWGDYDNDGDLDVLLAGSTGSMRISRVYRNDGDGMFADIDAGLPGLDQCVVAWGDCDSDGDLDILMTGSSDSGPLTRVYQNTGGVFADISAGLAQVERSTADWGDFDNDGDVDILLAGDSGPWPIPGDVSVVYRNDGGVFTDMNAGLPGVEQGAAAWGDYDNDGRLDLLLTGASGAGPLSRIYGGHGAPANTAPTMPEGLSADVEGDEVTLSWVGATDEQTATPGLSYNLRIGTTPGANDITSAMADGGSGWRRVVQLGNAQKRTSWTVKVPRGGEYYWSVQAIDGAYAGSPFAAEQGFRVVTFTDIGAGMPGFGGGAATWGDYDNDGNLDVLLTGDSDVADGARIYRNEGDVFADINAGLSRVGSGEGAWGDYDNDGDLDVVLTGYGESGPISRVYRNEGGVFVDVNAGLEGVGRSAVAWGDYDNDGDLDLVLAGDAGTWPDKMLISQVYRNDDDAFVDIAAGLPGVEHGAVAWGDYDNDGDLDLVVAGRTETVTISRVYCNDGGEFSEINVGLAGVGLGAAAWGDYDNDGNLDLVLTGYGDGGPISRVYGNYGCGFTDIDAGLVGVGYSAVAWGDCDSDGDLDLVLTGDAGIWPYNVPVSRVYRNDDGVFRDTEVGLPGLEQGAAAWGDYDNDGDLDLLLMGQQSDGSWTSSLYQSTGAPGNTPPSTPGGLSAEVVGDEVTLSWDGATDEQTPAGGLSYNLRIGTTPGGSEIASPMADGTNGWRRVVQLGNGQTRTSWTVRLPGIGEYYLSVQAIDGAYA